MYRKGFRAGLFTSNNANTSEVCAVLLPKPQKEKKLQNVERCISLLFMYNMYTIILLDYTKLNLLCGCFHLSVFCHHGVQDVPFITWRRERKKKIVMLILRNFFPPLLQLFRSQRWPSQITDMPKIHWVGQEQITGPRPSLYTAQNRPSQTEISPDSNRTVQLKYGPHARQTVLGFAQFKCV